MSSFITTKIKHKTHSQILLLIFAIISIQVISGEKEIDDFDDLEDEDDDEPEKEPIAKRQLNAVRDSIKHVFTPGIKFLTDSRIMKSMTNAITGKRVSTSPSSSTSTNSMNNFYRAFRTQLTKQSNAATQALIKQWQSLAKRLSNGRLAIGNLGAKLTNREESATKNTKADDVPPTVLPKEDKTATVVNSSIVPKAVKPKKKNTSLEPLYSMQQLPLGFPVMHPGYHPSSPMVGQPTGPLEQMVSGFLAPPPVYAVPQPGFAEWQAI